jgi:predicted dehydrogenase
MKPLLCAALLSGVMMSGSSTFAADTPAPAPFRIITLDPGHFHASLVQKFMVPDVDPLVRVYAPAGDDLLEHLNRINSFNARTNQPTRWREVVYTGTDFLAKMLVDRSPGNVVVIAGNNAHKTDYILQSVQAGFNVLADKPMVIAAGELPKLQQAFTVAASNHVLLYDIMTERFEITTILQRELSRQPALFGELWKGSPDGPAITMDSGHYFSKIVAGSPLKRPQWFFDVRQEGEGMADVGTHLVDLVQWVAFPEQALSPSDVQVLTARRFATPVTREQFKQVTGADEFPSYLQSDVKDGALQVYANGELTWRLRDTYARVSVRWDFGPPLAGGDTRHSVVRGTKATLIIRQDAGEDYRGPVLYIEQNGKYPADEFDAAVRNAISVLQKKYPGVDCQRSGAAWRVVVPDKYEVGHEAHFTQVTENYLGYLRAGQLPAWEVPNMLTKYATTMKAYELSR